MYGRPGIIISLFQAHQQLLITISPAAATVSAAVTLAISTAVAHRYMLQFLLFQMQHSVLSMPVKRLLSSD